MRSTLIGHAVLGTLLVAWTMHSAAIGAEEADPLRPSAIKADGVPPVPQSLVDRLLQYEDIRSAAFGGWAPNGQGILISTRFGNSSQLHQVYVPGGRREQLTFFPEPTGGQFIPETRDGSLLVTNSVGGNENFQISLLDRTAFTTTLLTDGKSRNELGPIRHDGQKMIVASNRRNGRDTDLYIADTRKPDSMEMLLETNSEFWVASDWSLDGKRLLVIHYVSANESYPGLLDVETKKLQKLPMPGEGKISFGELRFAPDGKTAYVACDARGEFQQLARLNLETLKYEWIVDDIPWDVASVTVDPHTGQVIFTINEDGGSKMYLLTADGQRRELETPLGIVGGVEFSPDSRHIGFSLARPDAPADAYSISLADGQLTRWTYSETGGLDPATFVSPTRVQYSTFDGRQIPAYYFRPKNASADHPVPVLIQIHGGPEGQYQPFFSGSIQYETIEMGIAVICPNVRGSSGYGKTYLALDNAEKREDSVKDIGALLDWVAQQPELDAKRVAVTGGSYGGYMVLASLTHFGDRIAAGIDIVGIANFITFLERTSPYRQDLRRAEYGNERDPKMRAVFERINPSANADKIRSALFVAHGINDPRVPFSEAQQIAEKVRATGRSVWTVYADNEGHGFAKKDNRSYLNAAEVLFLRKHLLD